MSPSYVQLSLMRNHTFPRKTLCWLSHSLRRQAQTFLPQSEQILSSLQTLARCCGRPSPLFSSSGGWHALTLKAVTGSFVYGVPCFFLSLCLRFFFFYDCHFDGQVATATAIYFIQAPTRIPKWSRLRAKYPHSTHKLVTTLAVMGDNCVQNCMTCLTFQSLFRRCPLFSSHLESLLGSLGWG